MRGRKLYFPSQSFVNQQTQTTTTTHTQRNFLFFKTIKNAENAELGLHKKSKKSLKKKVIYLPLFPSSFFLPFSNVPYCPRRDLWFRVICDDAGHSMYVRFFNVYLRTVREDREREARTLLLRFQKVFLYFYFSA